MSYMRFCVMDVGQGSANYIELREDNGSLTAAAIVDIGSEQWKTAAGKPSAEWIADQLETMTGGAKLDVIILSHSDSDHVNLIPSLIQYFDTPDDDDPTLPVLTIKEIIYGGDFGKYKKGRSVNFLTQLIAYHPEDDDDILTELEDDYSSFDADKKKWKPLAKIGGKIELWALSANTTAEKIPESAYGPKRKRPQLPDGGFAINTRSIVIAAIFGGKTIIATGDGTGLTLAHCNQQLAKQTVRDKLGVAYMVTLPHHGSDTTTYDLTGSQWGSAAANEVVQKFTEWTKPDTITGSAGERKTFRHPSARVIDDFGAYMLIAPQFIDPALTKTNQHFYTSYFFNRTLAVTPVGKKVPFSPNWPLFDWWYTARSVKNVFTTDYDSEMPGVEIPTAYPWESVDDGLNKFNPEPPRAISWGFRVNQNGTTSIQVVREREEAHAQYWAAAEAVHGPLPPRGFVVVDSAPLPGDDEPPSEPQAAPEPPRPGPPPPPPSRPSRPSRLRQLP